MAAPGSYTEKDLAAYMHAELGPVALALGLIVGASDAGSYAEAVNETLLQYGVISISLADDIVRLRSLARVYAWRKAVTQLAALFDFSADAGSYQRSNMFDAAEKNLARALMDALEYDAAYKVTVTRQNPVTDPYRCGGSYAGLIE
jgi:hypothetical protein